MRYSSANASRIFFLVISLLCCARAAGARPLNTPPRRIARGKRNDESATGQSQATSSTSPDFTVQMNPSSLTVSSIGPDVSGNVTLTGTGGFIDPVDLSCDISPVMINPPSCFLFGEQVNVDSTSSPSVVIFIVFATPPSCLDIYDSAAPGNFGGDSQLLSELEACVLAMALLVCSARLAPVPCRTKILRYAMICTAAFVMAGCSGSNNSGFQCSTGVPNAGTPAGMYTITVTATSGSISHSANIPLTVTSPF